MMAQTYIAKKPCQRCKTFVRYLSKHCVNCVHIQAEKKAEEKKLNHKMKDPMKAMIGVNYETDRTDKDHPWMPGSDWGIEHDRHGRML